MAYLPYKPAAIAMKLSLLIFLALFGKSLGADVTLQWDPNPATDLVTHYKILKQSGALWIPAGQTAIVAPGQVAARQFTVTGLSTGTHVFACTAVNEVAESDKSNTVTKIIPAPPGAPKNVIVFTVTVTVP